MPTKKEKPNTKVLSVTHIRRCHVCGTVSESEGAVNLKCKQCGKHLAPFYFFSESELEGIPIEGPHLSLVKQATSCFPIYGLSTYWSDA